MKPDVNPSSLKTLKMKNRREVLELVRRASPISIADISEQTSLSKATVTNILEHYRKMGLVAAEKAGAGEERGKRPQIFTINPDYKYLFCAKVDGYFILATLTDIRGKVFSSHTSYYDKRLELPQMIQSVSDVFRTLIEREGKDAKDCLAIVAGLPGIIDPETGVCFLSPQFLSWGKNINLKKMLADTVPENIPVYIDNWVHYYGRGEATVAPERRFMLISTVVVEGVNGAFMVDGKYHRGPNCLASELGHLIVDTTPEAEVCLCGGKGCFEPAVAPKRMLERIHKRIKAYADSQLYDKFHQTGAVTFVDVCAAANSGDEFARSELSVSARHFGIAIRNIMQTCDPETVVIEGAYATAGGFFLDEVRTAIPRTSLLELDKTVEVRYSTLGEYGAIIGAAQSALDLFFAEA